MNVVPAPATRRALPALLVSLLLITSCGREAVDSIDTPDFKRVEVSLVDGPIAPPVSIDGVCVIQAPKLNAVQLLLYWLDPALSVMKHIGNSIERCSRGEATPTVGRWNSFFDTRIDISYRGDCPGTAYSCFLQPDLIVLDPEAISSKEQPEGFVASLIGHELYHAIAGNYHP